MTLGRALLVASTLGAVGLAVRAVWLEPPPLFVAILAAALYLGVLGLGALVPALEMYGAILTQVPDAKGRVALTFDDGPDPATTPRVLELLAERGARATFFVVGKKAEAHPELVQRIAREGHTLGIHSYAHHRGYAFLPPQVVKDDIERCRSVIERASGVRTDWFRPPVGQASPRTFAGVELAEAVVVGWSIRAYDGVRGRTEASVVRRIERRLFAGAIVLLHDAWERGPSEPAPAGVRALGELLDACERAELRPVTLDELVS